MDMAQVPGVVQQVYQRVLARDPDPQGMIWYGSRLSRDEMNVKDVVKDVGFSQEYLDRFVNGVSPGDAVRNAYWHFLARDPDPTAQEAYERISQVQGFHSVIAGLLESQEYQQKFGTQRVPN